MCLLDDGFFLLPSSGRTLFNIQLNISSMNIENKGQYPSFDLFVKLITMFDVSVDQFIHANGGASSSSCRKHIDVLLNSMNEKELVVIEATAEGIKKARETEVQE